MSELQRDQRQWDLAIDRDSEVPIGVQLAWALRAGIGDGRFAAGERLPGLRELAQMLGINANTARAVYQRLEHEGLVDSRQGTGTFVASVPPKPTAVGEIAAQAARQAHETGVDPREVAAALFVTSAPAGVDELAADAERRRDLRNQIAALERALSEMQREHPQPSARESAAARLAGPRLLSVTELEQTRAGLVQRISEIEPSPSAEAESQAPEVKAAKAARPSTKRPPRPKIQPRPSTA
jgi:DNA-binding transcriptional regulator YhcF (GntR family)